MFHRNTYDLDDGYCPLASKAHKPLRWPAPFLAASVLPLGYELPSATRVDEGQNENVKRRTGNRKVSLVPTHPPPHLLNNFIFFGLVGVQSVRQ